MTINQNIREFAGLPVVDVDDGVRAGLESAAWRISPGYEAAPEEFAEQLDALLARTSVEALVVGNWGEPYENPAPIDALVAAAPRMPNLRALFLGEMTFEECEISWIKQADVTPLLAAFPSLEVLRVRGSDSLVFPPTTHANLRELAFESGGLPGRVVRGVAASDFPRLRLLPRCVRLRICLPLEGPALQRITRVIASIVVAWTVKRHADADGRMHRLVCPR